MSFNRGQQRGRQRPLRYIPALRFNPAGDGLGGAGSGTPPFGGLGTFGGVPHYAVPVAFSDALAYADGSAIGVGSAGRWETYTFGFPGALVTDCTWQGGSFSTAGLPPAADRILRPAADTVLDLARGYSLEWGLSWEYPNIVNLNAAGNVAVNVEIDPGANGSGQLFQLAYNGSLGQPCGMFFTRQTFGGGSTDTSADVRSLTGIIGTGRCRLVVAGGTGSTRRYTLYFNGTNVLQGFMPSTTASRSAVGAYGIKYGTVNSSIDWLALSGYSP